MSELRLFLLKFLVNLIVFDFLISQKFALEGLALGYCVICYTAYMSSRSLNQFIISICINLLLIYFLPVQEVKTLELDIPENEEGINKILLVLGLFVVFYCMLQ